MKIIKHILAIVLASLTFTAVYAGGNNLWEHFRGRLSSIEERALVYEEIGSEEYKGTAEQNIKLHSYFDKDISLGALAFPPSTVEGTSTAGWTDDGSIVRLNTSSDSVGIGTSNPAEKLTVTGGNFLLGGDIVGITGDISYIGGDVSISGGDLNLGTGSATTTLTVDSNGRLGVGTTSPAARFSVQGNVFITGTTTIAGGLEVASSTTKINGVELNWPTNDGDAGQQLRTDGSGNLSWTAAGGDPESWEELTNSVLSSASSSWSVLTSSSTRKFYQIKFYLESNGSPGTITVAPNVTSPANIHSFSIYNATSTNTFTLNDECFINPDSGGDERNLSGIIEINAASSTQLFYNVKTTSYRNNNWPEIFEVTCTGPNPGTDSFVFNSPGAGDFDVNSRIIIYASRF